MEQLFFSYSRADSDFVLKLAKDMRSAGANLWIDQLDIAPGDRWDRAVEEALGAAPCLAVILSPELVVSQNVMDEVSLAFDEQKKILPILFRKCNIPFRLRRLQYVDFTANYDAGLAELLGAIKVQQKTDVQAGHDGSDKPTIISTLSSREKAAGAAAPLASARRGEADQKTNGLHLRPGNWFRNWFRSRSFLVGLVLVLAGLGSVFLPGLLKRSVEPATKAAQITSPASPSPKRALNYFYGAWENTDAQTRGLARLEIRTDGPKILVTAWGKCHPTDCAWGEVTADAYGEGVSTPVGADVRTILAVYKTNFSDNSLTIRPESQDMLRVDSLTHFTDTSGRPNYTLSFLFRRAP